MIKNYLKITFRSLFKNRLYTSINIIGLAISLTCFFLIFIWVADQLSYDRFFNNSEDIYRINTEVKGKGTTVLSVDNAAQALKDNYPEVISFCRVEPFERDLVIKYGDKVFFEEGAISADANFFDFFSFNIIRGNKKTLLDVANKIVITRHYSEKIFGKTDPIGKVLNFITRGHTRQFIVSGVIEDIPHNSHLRFNFVTPLTGIPYWGNGWQYTVNVSYIRLSPGTDPKTFEEKISGFVNRFENNSPFKLRLQPLTKIQLYSHGLNDAERVSDPGDIKYVYIFSIIAFIILLLASANFINLSLTHFFKKAKETGIRKIVGAERYNIVLQYLCESLLLVTAAGLITIIIVQLALPFYNNIIGSSLHMNLSDYKSILGFSIIMLFVGLLSGFYPALLISSTNSIHILQNSFLNGLKGITIKKALIIFQFVLSTGMIAAIFIIQGQMQFILKKNLGFNKDQVIYFVGHDIPGDPKEELLTIPSVQNVCWLSELPLDVTFQLEDTEWNGRKDNDIRLYYLYVDPGFLKTFNINLKEGRNFSDDFATDKYSYIINESAAAAMGLKKPVGGQLTCLSALKAKVPGNIIGVIKDFHFTSLHNKIEPLVLGMYIGKPWYIALKLKGGTIDHSITLIRNKLNALYPDYYFNYKFLDEAFAKQYYAEKRMSSLMAYFTFFVLVISSIGLFGLVSISASQSIKEIGIRKILGASVINIAVILTKKYFLLIAIAAMISCPLTYYIMDKWLEDFAYRIEFNWLVFVFSISITFIIALITVSYQAIKAALANPVESLRYE